MVTIKVDSCNPGYYGVSCKQRCAMCIRPDSCFHTNGTCPDGCKLWWASSKCDKQVNRLNHSNETIALKSKTSNSLTVVWQHIHGVETGLEQFYGYSIQYKEHDGTAGYTEALNTAYSSKPSAVIANLAYHTLYDIKLVPYRTNHSEKDYGTPYPVLEAKTNCVAPEKPTILNATLSRRSGGLGLTVFFQDVADMKSRCDSITNITLLYRQVDTNAFKAVHIRPGETTHHIPVLKHVNYEMKLRIQNNEGYASTSDIIKVGSKLCAAGFYGDDCKPCGFCKKEACNVLTGVCPGGCEMWATGDRCETRIVFPELPDDKIKLLAVGTRSIKIGWQQIPEITPELYKYYGLNIMLNTLNGVKDHRVVPYTGNSTVLENLNYDTFYDIRVQVFRKKNGVIDRGHVSEELRARTKCHEPPPMKITDIQQLDSGTGLPKLVIQTDKKTELLPDCGQIARARVRYKRKDEAEFHEESVAGDLTKWSFAPTTPDEYLVQFITENEQGVETVGPIQTIPVTCYPGYYGTNCTNNCGHCRKSDECDHRTGKCLNGCQTWWTGTMCDGHIDSPEIYNETARLKSRTNTSISVSWDALHSIKPELAQYYGYSVQYKQLDRDTKFTRIPEKDYLTNLSEVIRNLIPYTNYAVQIVPFRRHRSSKEFSTPYPTIKTRTYCGVPVKPAAPKVNQIFGEYGLPNITLLFERMRSEDVHCDNITSFVLRYKMANEDNYKVVSLDPERDNNVDIYPREEGQLECQVIVQNNAHFETSSDLWRIAVIMKCKIGYYGHQCKEKCAKCKGSPACEKHTGACPNGCQVWWAGTKCDKYIDMPKDATELDSATPSDGNTIIVKWKHTSNITNELGHHYGYSLQYKKHNSDDNYTEAAILKLATNYTEAIRDLDYNTMYDVRIAFFKRHGRLRHFDSDYKTITVKTGCGEPEKPKFVNMTLITSVSRLPNISVTIGNITKQLANCDNITSIMLRYKLKDAVNFTVVRLHPGQSNFIIVPEEAGDYLLELVIKNNKGYTSSSELQVIKVEKPLLLSMMSMIVPGAILTALVAVLITVTAAVLCKGSSSKFRN